MRPKCRNPFYERKEEKGRKGRKMRGGKKKNGPECNEDPLSAKCRGPKNV